MKQRWTGNLLLDRPSIPLFLGLSERFEQVSDRVDIVRWNRPAALRGPLKLI
ncbi:hypothetical protein [Leptolyngbya sp. FACHB-16]|uniref:hypothetical protein n=1 Tax=unclassified Leptolyngbya TaxID=2650499 RepID=UPI001A7EB46A|nr:hypothetical protein [Leptolyngbya sp. FACHB-16]